MKLILHIMAKDARRLWLEITLAFLLNAALVWQDARPVGDGRDVWWGLIPLLPLAWLVVIARLVHGERLVGDDAWWLTRPYRRRDLLAAKCFLTLIVVHLVPLIGDSVVLSVKGFAPWLYLQPLAFKHLAWMASLTLPALALAAITRGMAQYFPGVIVLLAFAGIVDSLMAHGFTGGWSTIRASLILAPMVVAAAAAALWQFAQRRTSGSWTVLVAGVATGAAVAFLIPVSWLIGRIYAEPEVGPQLAASENSSGTGGDASGRIRGTWQLPIDLKTRRPELDWHREGVWAEVKSDAVRLRPEYTFWTPPDWGGGNLVLSMRAQDQARLGSRKVDVQAHVALREWRNVEAARLKELGSVVDVPGIGACVATRNPASPNLTQILVDCESPRPMPHPLRMAQLLPDGRLAMASLTASGSHPGISRMMMLSPIHRVHGALPPRGEPGRSDSELEPVIAVYRQERTRRGIRTMQWAGIEWERFTVGR